MHHPPNTRQTMSKRATKTITQATPVTVPEQPVAIENTDTFKGVITNTENVEKLASTEQESEDPAHLQQPGRQSGKTLERAGHEARYFFERQWDYNLASDHHRMIDNCADEIAKLFDYDKATAKDIAQFQYSEVDARRANIRINLNSSTSQLLIVTDRETGNEHLITSGELFNLLKRRR